MRPLARFPFLSVLERTALEPRLPQPEELVKFGARQARDDFQRSRRRLHGNQLHTPRFAIGKQLFGCFFANRQVTDRLDGVTHHHFPPLFE